METPDENEMDEEFVHLMNETMESLLDPTSLEQLDLNVNEALEFLPSGATESCSSLQELPERDEMKMLLRNADIPDTEATHYSAIFKKEDITIAMILNKDLNHQLLMELGVSMGHRIKILNIPTQLQNQQLVPQFQFNQQLVPEPTNFREKDTKKRKVDDIEEIQLHVDKHFNPVQYCKKERIIKIGVICNKPVKAIFCTLNDNNNETKDLVPKQHGKKYMAEFVIPITGPTGSATLLQFGVRPGDRILLKQAVSIYGHTNQTPKCTFEAMWLTLSTNNQLNNWEGLMIEFNKYYKRNLNVDLPPYSMEYMSKVCNDKNKGKMQPEWVRNNLWNWLNLVVHGLAELKKKWDDDEEMLRSIFLMDDSMATIVLQSQIGEGEQNPVGRFLLRACTSMVSKNKLAFPLAITYCSSPGNFEKVAVTSEDAIAKAFCSKAALQQWVFVDETGKIQCKSILQPSTGQNSKTIWAGYITMLRSLVGM